MEVLALIGVAVFVLSILGYIGANVFRFLQSVSDLLFRDFINTHLLFKNLRPEYKESLAKYFRFYRFLEGKEKERFEKRVQKFIDSKKFIPRKGIEEVTVDMKALIAATAIQITLGFPGIYFKHFWRILIYEDDYYSTITKKYHLGEVNLKGIIVLSWNNFLKGFIEHDDGRNLGYHEMAHALRLEDAVMNREYLFLNPYRLRKVDYLAGLEIKKMKKEGAGFLRKYAATNLHEFFAVLVENFFERPNELKEYNPKIYQAMCDLLKQDPLKYYA